MQLWSSETINDVITFYIEGMILVDISISLCIPLDGVNEILDSILPYLTGE